MSQPLQLLLGGSQVLARGQNCGSFLR